MTFDPAKPLQRHTKYIKIVCHSRRTFDVDLVKLAVVHHARDVDDGRDVEDEGRTSTGFPHKITVPDVPLKDTQLGVPSAV